MEKQKIINIKNVPKIPDICGFAKDLINPESTKIKSMSIAFIIIEQNKKSRQHYHKIMDEIYFILEGNGEVVLNGTKYPIGPGDAIYITQNEYHEITNTGDIPLTFLSIDSPPYDESDIYYSK